MTRLPPALWLLGLAVAVSWLTREPAPRAARAAGQVTRAAPGAPPAGRPAGTVVVVR
jgi:hypothetical protein